MRATTPTPPPTTAATPFTPDTATRRGGSVLLLEAAQELEVGLLALEALDVVEAREEAPFTINQLKARLPGTDSENDACRCEGVAVKVKVKVKTRNNETTQPKSSRWMRL